MSKFIESIAVIEGEIRNFAAHQKRMFATLFALYGENFCLDLEEIFPEIPSQGKYKCRVVYDQNILDIQLIEYEIRTMNSFRLVENDALDYRWKFEDRRIFDEMKNAVDQDEIIIVQEGQVTDTSFSNLVFFDGKNWITPTTYLLNGTMRQSLLAQHRIIEQPIGMCDLRNFQSFKLINAMMDLDESPNLPITMIHGIS